MKPLLVDFTLNEAKPWVLAFLPGQRTKNGSADTLKKQCASLPLNTSPQSFFSEGFMQVLPLRAVASPTHLAWAGFGLIQSLETNTLHFRQPELEFISRVAGTFQWKDVLEKVTLQNTDKDVVLLWMGPRSAWSEKLFLRISSAWGFSPRKWPVFSTQDETLAVERSALAGLE